MQRAGQSRDWFIVIGLCATIVSATACSEKPKPVVETVAQAAPADAAESEQAREENENRVEEDWPCFLGPKGTGESSETHWLKRWPDGGPKVGWQKRIGTGYSAPSVMGNRLVVHHRPRTEDIIECLAADTGDELWKVSYTSEFSDPYGYNNGPRCTPLLTKDRCYTLNPEGKLFCLELETGKEIWKRDCSQDFRIPQNFFGVGCTPILEGDLLIVLVGGRPNSGVVAFRAADGEIVWQNVGKATWDGAETGDPDQPKHRWADDESLVSYSTPIAATIHGQRHILCQMRQGFVSLDPKDGSVNFKYWFRPTVHEAVNAARPVVIDDKIFLSAAYELGSVLLQVQPSGKDFKVLWKNSRNLLTHWSTTIHVNGYLYGFSGRHENEGELRCLDLKTGRVQWQTTGYEGDLSKLSQDSLTGEIKDSTGKTIPFPFYGRGSKIQIGDRFLVLGERGTLSLIRINPEKFEELGRTSYEGIRYPSWGAPVLSRGRVYLRSETHLVCLDVTN